MRQTGGLTPLLKVPPFKYTFNESRKLFISTIYPYSEYLLDCVVKIPFNTYAYNGECEYRDYVNNGDNISKCKSLCKPTYRLTGGSVYEILNKKHPNVDLHKYCDATGDIDVAVYPPKLTYSEMGDVYFLNAQKKVNSFYKHFTEWLFNEFLQNLKSIQPILNKISPSLTAFDITEYKDILPDHINPDLGFMMKTVGKLRVVGFLNETSTMYKIQVVCKLVSDTTEVIDHAVEFIIPLDVTPSADDYDMGDHVYNTIGRIHIDNYSNLISDNIDAYSNRKSLYSGFQNNFIHKSINHIARMFYLYELFYQNRDKFKDELKTGGLLYVFGMNAKKRTQIETLYYYKMVDGIFQRITVETKDFINAYLEIVKLNTYMYNTFNSNPNNAGYLNVNAPADELHHAHDLFIAELSEPPKPVEPQLSQPQIPLSPTQIKLDKKKKNKTRRNQKNKKNKKQKNSQKNLPTK